MSELTATDYKKKDARKRRKNDKKHLQHLKALWEKLGHMYFCPVTPRDKHREYNKEDPEYYAREWRSQRSKRIKKKCNGQLRNADEEEIFRHGEYKKKSEFWWDYD